MNNQSEVREFLMTRRARLTPEQAGIIGGGRRRVAGLRREEVAMLAGMSVDYYAKMERGNLSGVSPEVLNALARALRLDDAEISHLQDLAAAAAPVGVVRRRKPRVEASVRPTLQRFLDTIIDTPVYVTNPCKDFLATNVLGAAVFAPIIDDPANGRNNARFVFLNPFARTYYPDWEAGARSIVATLRIAAGQNPHDRALTDLIGELVTRSNTFRTMWAAHDVRFHRSGTKRINHPVVGDLQFHYEAFDLPGSDGLVMYACTVDPASPSAERLQLLGSLASTSRAVS
ncbi:helix-turn-helix transcriptional regulator [Microbacterium sp. Au-Mic1]|uniref:helix-turn-helix transcriptional regulator n=1 Tax=Microbacterium sp. Au-Mic1 TaxID=2906457 RepID=UPI001E43A435|nr:helix-turn-helix transcriptional regulator [Microbacterium sp. Au-Mic1]MCE4024778.1 helix-turn-helix transcriptional regulator [Microbacterium sp. Au-Mic1]